MKINTIKAIIFLLLLVTLGVSAEAKSSPMEQMGNQIITTALSKLDAKAKDGNLACLTNAGYVTHNGQSTFPLLDLIAQKSEISIGRGNLLQIHTAATEPLWTAFVQKKSSQELYLTYLQLEGNSVTATDPINVYVDIDTPFDQFTSMLGDNAFSLVTFANGWADKIPQDLMQGALWHDHLCSGVFGGFFTVGFIRKQLALREKENYIYIGAPAWCQDDYINRVLNLTAGKSSYHTMSYPWSRPWTTAEESYAQLGGIVIRFNSATKTGEAALLRFDWREEDFKAFIGMPGLVLNWGKDKWLHVSYNRFFMQHLNEPEKFVSIIKTKELKSQQELNRLIYMGANPLEEMLGPDPQWTPERN